MKFIGLFGACYFLILISASLFFHLFENIYGIIAVAAFLMASVLRMFLSLDERIEQLEHELGLAKKKEATLSETLKEEPNDPTEI